MGSCQGGPIRLVQPEKQISLDVTARKGGPGHYIIDSAVFSAAGTWEVQIAARVSEFDEYAQTIEIPIRDVVTRRSVKHRRFVLTIPAMELRSGRGAASSPTR